MTTETIENLVAKLTEVAQGNLLATEVAIVVAARPDFAQRTAMLQLNDKIVVNLLTKAIWEMSQTIPAPGTEWATLANKFEAFLEEYFEKNSTIAPEPLKRWYINALQSVISLAQNKLSRFAPTVIAAPTPVIKPKPSLPELDTHVGKKRGKYKTKKAKMAENVPDNPDVPKEYIAICPKCNKEGYKSVRYADEYPEPGKPPIREYHYGLVHESPSTRPVFHRMRVISEAEAKELMVEFKQNKIISPQTSQIVAWIESGLINQPVQKSGSSKPAKKARAYRRKAPQQQATVVLSPILEQCPFDGALSYRVSRVTKRIGKDPICHLAYLHKDKKVGEKRPWHRTDIIPLEQHYQTMKEHPEMVLPHGDVPLRRFWEKLEVQAGIEKSQATTLT